MPNIKISKEDLSVIRCSIRTVWEAIGSDVLSACSEAGERCDNETAVETCIDADRLLDYDTSNGKHAQEMVRELITRHNYQPVLTFLSKNIPLN